MEKSSDVLDNYFLIKLKSGNLNNISINVELISNFSKMISDGILCLTNHDMHGYFYLLYVNEGLHRKRTPKNPDFVVKLGLCERGETKSSEDILGMIKGFSFDNLVNDNEFLEANLLCENYDFHGESLWGGDLPSISKEFSESCRNIFKNSGGIIEVIGPYGNRIIYNEYEDGYWSDGWGIDEEEPVDMPFFITDNFKNLADTQEVKLDFVEYIFNNYWKK